MSAAAATGKSKPATVIYRADAQAVSCATASSCVAGGSRFERSSYQAFVVKKSEGIWRTPVIVPGTAALNTGGQAAVASVSCPSAGECAVGGFYVAGGRQEAFVANEKGGIWQNAIEVPGTAALNVGGSASVSTISCASAGNCAAGGWYSDNVGTQAFVVDEKDGVWGTATPVPGAAALDTLHGGQLLSVSCTAVGECSAVGWYVDGAHHQQSFVVDETAGFWGTAEEAPGTAALEGGGSAVPWSVSCSSAGNCAAGGSTYDSSGHSQAFVLDEKDGVWGDANDVPGLVALNTGSQAVVWSISCPAAGECAAAGFYADHAGPNHEQAFVVNERGGVWRNAHAAPGTKTLNSRDFAELESVSCSSAGNCTAGGFYTDRSSQPGKAFVVSERNGVWRAAHRVSGIASKGPGGSARVTSVSCVKHGGCAVVGWYIGNAGQYRTFMTVP